MSFWLTFSKGENILRCLCMLRWNRVEAFKRSQFHAQVLVRQEHFCKTTSTSEICLVCIWGICRFASQCATMTGRLFDNGKWPEASHWSEVILHLRWSLLDQLWLSSSVNRKNLAAVRQLNRLLIACHNGGCDLVHLRIPAVFTSLITTYCHTRGAEYQKHARKFNSRI